MFTWNFQYISKARLMETLRQLNLSATSGDIIIRVHTTIHLPEEAVELAKFIKGIVPKAKIFGSSTSAVINWGRYVQNQCIISVTMMDDGQIHSAMVPFVDEESRMQIPPNMLCGQIRQELIQNDTKLLLTVFGGHYYDIYQFVDRCNDFFPGIPMIGGMASRPQTYAGGSSASGYVFNEDGWSDQSVLLAAFSGRELESFVSYATGVQVIGEEAEITDAFRNCLLTINDKDALSVFQLGLENVVRDHPKLINIFPYVFSESEEIPIVLHYRKDTSLQELFPKGDPINEQEYLIRSDLDPAEKKDFLAADFIVKPGRKIKRAFIYDDKIIADNRALFHKVENFEKAETIFAYTGLARSTFYSNCVKWEISAYENSNASGCVLAGEIAFVNGKNTYANSAFLVAVMGEKPFTQEYNPYAYAHADAMVEENEEILNFLMELETSFGVDRDDEQAERLRTFVRECERRLLFSDTEDVPNEAALNMDIKLRGYDRVCMINVQEKAEMESVFSEHLIDLTYKNYVSKCLNFARAKKYHAYVLDGWQVAIAEPSYRVSLSTFAGDMEKLQKELFDYSEEFIAIVPIFCVIDGCTAENLQASYYSSRVIMMDKNVQFYVCDASKENDLDVDSIRERYHMINVINYAITHDKVIPYFQGIHDNKEGRIHHYESLMRLQDEEGTVYYPDSFLDIARSFGVLYDEISKMMIRKVFSLFRDVEGSSVSINLGIRDIKNKEILDLIYDSLSQVPHPDQFVFEILENEDIDDYNVMVSFVDRVHELGGKVSIDDFGSGFSNLQHLLSIHCDYLKIDGSIIRSCCVSKDSENIIALISGWKNLASTPICIVAEFVENEEIQKKVISYGVDYSQGYLFSKPSPQIDGITF